MIQEIRAKIAVDLFELSRHAVDQSLKRGITIAEMLEAIAIAELIEDYPQDKYGPTCLILGYTQAKRPLRILCSYPTRPLIKIITVYEPDPQQWIDHRVRKA
ncbi:MAG TPA: DUF4258 domain-containing protein [Tepidisphaeraceae bacterium]|jgi:hypothetical protein|nr:DUF4258 domain-containing protein [Tepidisphaeraceae bacterium]